MAVRYVAKERPRSISLDCRVEVLQGLYGVLLFVFLVLTILVLAIGGPSHYSIEKWAALGLCGETTALIYFGLRLRKKWVVPLIVFTSAIAIPRCVVGLSATVLTAVLSRVVVALPLYQLWFFRLPETRRFFGSGGATVF
jgi:hypothetical protein